LITKKTRTATEKIINDWNLVNSSNKGQYYLPISFNISSNPKERSGEVSICCFDTLKIKYTDEISLVGFN
jgi:hypothetical protein